MSDTTKRVDDLLKLFSANFNDGEPIRERLGSRDTWTADAIVEFVEDFVVPHFTKQLEEAEIVDKWVAHLLENVYPLDIFPKETGGGHVAGIYHGMHILRREVRGLSGRDDLEFLPQETEEYYEKLRTNLTQNTKGGNHE